MQKEYKCFLCCKFHVRIRRPIKQPSLRQYVSKLSGRDPGSDDVISNNCRRIYYNSLKKTSSSSPNLQISDNSDGDFNLHTAKTSNNKESSPRIIQLTIPSTHSSHKYCVSVERKATNV